MKLVRVTTVPMSLRYLLRGQLRFMKSKGVEVLAVSSDGDEIDAVRKYEGVDHVVIKMTRRVTPLRDLLAIIKMAVFLSKNNVDIVHSHTPKAGLVAMLASKLAGVKVRVHTVAGLPWMESSGFKRWLLKSTDKFIYKTTTRVYVNSNRLEDYLVHENVLKQSKAKVLLNGSSNGTDLDFFNPLQVKESKEELREIYKIPKDDFVYIYVGRIVKDKGVNELYSAFKAVPGNIQLVLVGPFEDNLDPISQEASDYFKNEKRVHVLGYQEDVRPFYKLADALVFPSYREGFPNVPMQAGAMGLPSIVTNINGCNEIIKEGINGLLIPVKNVEALSNAMTELSCNDDMYSSMATNSRQIVSDNYNQALLWEEIYKEYVDLVKNV